MAAPRRRGGEQQTIEGGPKTLEVAGVTLANGGDNLGVHVPVLATAGVGEMSVYAVAFLILVAVWCFAGGFFATRRSSRKHSAGGMSSCRS